MNLQIQDSFNAIKVLIDTGADISLIKANVLKSTTIIDNKAIKINGITNDQIESLGKIETQIYLPTNKTLTHTFHIIPGDILLPFDAIVGLDFISKFSAILDYSKWELTINKPFKISLPIFNGPKKTTSVIPPRSESIRKIPFEIEDDVVIHRQEIEQGVYVANTVVSRNSPYVRILNTNNNMTYVNLNQLDYSNVSDYFVYKTTELDPEHDEKILQLINSNTRAPYNKSFTEFCKSYTDIFSLKDELLTTNNFYKQKILVKDNEPVYKRNYRMPHAQKSIVKEKIEELIDKKIIEPSSSPYNSPLLLVPKKSTDGKPNWRLVIDYRDVNKKIIPDKYPLPRISDILDSLGRCKFFSIIDLQSAFHQIELEPESRDITSFSCDYGSYRFVRVPFGLNISPNAFSRMMAIAFSGLKPEQAFLYMDDIIVIGCSEKHQLNNIKDVFNTCRKHNLKLNPEKCKFFQREVTFLGHRCTDVGISPDPDKLSAIRDYPTPTNSDEAIRFIQFANYYRRFIQNFSHFSKPITSISGKKAKFIWSEKCQESFEYLKKCLENPPVLKYPDFERPFTIITDASNLAAGAVLTQEYDGVDLPIAYFSRSFTKGERNKPTIEKELLAIYFAVQHFKPYIYLSKFYIKTDHKPLVHLFTLRNPSSRLTNIRLELEEYQFEVIYIPGKTNVVADALSRIDIDQLKKLHEETNEFYKVLVLTRSKTHKNKNKKIADNTEHDPVPHQAVYQTLNNYEIYQCPKIKFNLSNRDNLRCDVLFRNKNRSFTLLLNNYVTNASLDLRGVLKRIEELCLARYTNKLKIEKNDPIFELTDLSTFARQAQESLKTLQIVVGQPINEITDEKEKIKIIKKYHEDSLLGGHCGNQRLFAKIRSMYKWKNMRKQILEYTKSCEKCQINKIKIKNHPNYIETDTPTAPFETILIDLIGRFPKTQAGNTMAITIQCDLTKYIIIIPIEDKTAKVVAQALLDNFFLIYGNPRKIKSDCGSEWINEIFNEMTKILEIKHCVSTPYHPQTIAPLERNHRYLNTYLRSYVNEAHTDWDIYTKFYAFHWNTSPMPLLKNYSPFDLVFNRKPNIPCTLFGTIDPLYNPENLAKHNKFRYQLSLEKANQWLREFKKLQTERLNEKTKEIKFEENDKILVTKENRTKLDPFYVGPFKVIKIEHPNLVIIKDNKEHLIHMNRAIKFNERKLWND